MPRSSSPQFIKAKSASRPVVSSSGIPRRRGSASTSRPAASRAFVFRYFVAGRKRVMTLGEFGPLTLTAAREMARERKGQVVKGADPLAKKRARRDALTGGQRSKMYLAGREAGTIGHRKPKPRSMEGCGALSKRTGACPTRTHPQMWIIRGLMLAFARWWTLLTPEGFSRRTGAREALSALFTWPVKSTSPGTL